MTRRSSASPPDLLAAALAYPEIGFSVFPLQQRGKRPLTRHGVNDATKDPGTIRQWWSRWPCANVGLAVPAGLIVLDLDSDEALQRIRAEDLTLPTTVSATTGRGRHLWYSTGRATVSNRVELFQGVDVRAKGGYVVAPPSIHPSGTEYRWVVPLKPSAISEGPEWLLQRISERTAKAGSSSDAWHQKIATPVLEGRRNQTLAEVAGLLFRKLPATEAAELAYCWAQVRMDPPLPDREIQRTLDSIAGREYRRRGGGA